MKTDEGQSGLPCFGSHQSNDEALNRNYQNSDAAIARAELQGPKQPHTMADSLLLGTTQIRGSFNLTNQGLFSSKLQTFLKPSFAV